MHDIGVIYLCRFAEGEAPVRRFLASYSAHPAGVEHDLHIVFKGFTDHVVLDRFRALFEGLAINAIELDDSGFDLGAYVRAAKVVKNRRVIFLNTFSEILSDDWLRHFDNAMNEPGVGIVGATGSWLSGAAGYERVFKRVVTALWRKMTFAPQTPASTVTAQVPLGIAMQSRPAMRYLFAIPDYLYLVYRYGRHPNPHLRTNAIMVDRQQFLSLRFPTFRDKRSTYAFESGKQSLTRQYLARGLKPVVVDRVGKTHTIDQWRDSVTFWTGDQENLIIADRRTMAYTDGSPDIRVYLEHSAWRDPWTAR